MQLRLDYSMTANGYYLCRCLLTLVAAGSEALRFRAASLVARDGVPASFGGALCWVCAEVDCSEGSVSIGWTSSVVGA